MDNPRIVLHNSVLAYQLLTGSIMEVFGHSTNVSIIKNKDGQPNRTKAVFEMKVSNLNKAKCP